MISYVLLVILMNRNTTSGTGKCLLYQCEQSMYCTSKYACTVIRFVWVSAKFGTCTVESVNGTLVAAKVRKCAHSPLNQRILSSSSVPFTLTTVHVPNLILNTVYSVGYTRRIIRPSVQLFICVEALSGPGSSTLDKTVGLLRRPSELF
jgi:hypothetical protein